MTLVVVLVAGLLGVAAPAAASSHREAPGILGSPQVDGTDFYMFRSYEPGRDGYVTLIANYNPLQDAYGGPNYFPLDPDAAYDIHISNDGDAIEDITFRFRVAEETKNIALEVGEGANTATVAIPLQNAGPFGPFFGNGALNTVRRYRVSVIRGDLANPTSVDSAINPTTNRGLFGMPFDNIGEKSIPNYARYAQGLVRPIQIPGCSDEGRVFAGQRQESFAVNLGEVFDLVNLNPLGDPDAGLSVTDDKNITSLILELPIACLTEGNGDVIAAWTTSRLPKTRMLGDGDSAPLTVETGELVQVSRLANPLVNEVAIGLPDKNRFNASQPRNDPQFLTYVTNPTLPELLEILFGVTAPNLFPREDLIQVFLTGVPGLNDDGSVGEMMRLNTAIPPTPRAQQNNLGVIGGDLAGYPNGRRPGDDTVDISLRAVMGVLLDETVAPSGQLPYTDGADQNAMQFGDAFPYLNNPLPGSPNSE
ncbi:MAG: DUF4331 domain-containing protein [Acidobacteriota bacterium]